MLNIGSITKIEIIEAENITVSKPDSDNKVTIELDGSFETISHQLESASLVEVEKQVSEGVINISDLKFTVAKKHPDTIAALNNYINTPAVIRITDGNQQCYILGTDSVPLYILRSSTIPAKTAGLNGYQFKVNYRNPLPVPFCG